jgi:o-succinylbenzoate synthase
MDYRPFALDLAHPLSTARGRIERREGFLVVAAVDGARGVGEATPLPGWTESRADCRATLAAADDDAVAALADPNAEVDLDDTPAARHGLELAALDALSRHRGRPLAATLAERAGTTATESVPANATVGDGDVAATVDAATAAVDDGFQCVKLKVGARSLDADADRLRAVREAVESDVTLRADANGAWDRETAEAAVTTLGPLVSYLEQPLPAADLSGHAALRGRGVDIAVDESVAGAGVDAVLEAGAADVLVLKPMAFGGPARAAGAALRARDRGVDPVVTTTIDAAPARTAAVHVAAAIPGVRPCGLATADALESDLAPDPAPVRDGRIEVPAAGGIAGDAFDALVD